MDGSGADDQERSELLLQVPALVRAAFRETLDLYRAVEGCEAPIVSFVEALLAESMTEPLPVTVDGDPAGEAHAADLRRGVEREAMEAALDRAADGWKHLDTDAGQYDGPDARRPERAVRLAGSTLARLKKLERRAGQGDARDLDSQMRGLLALQNELEIRLGEVLSGMGEMAAWMHLGFADVGHYAERRLGMCRTAAEDRVWVARTVRSYRLIRMAYERGELGWEATRHILRLLKGCAADEATQRAWIERGRRATVKRLKDEVKALQRQAALEEGGCDAGGSDSSERDSGGSCAGGSDSVRSWAGGGDSDGGDSGGSDSGRGDSGGDGAGRDGTGGGDGGRGGAAGRAVSGEGPASSEGVCSPEADLNQATAAAGHWTTDRAAARMNRWARRAPLPMSDEAWHSSLRREPGSTRALMGTLGRALARQAEAQTSMWKMNGDIMRLRLPTGLAVDFHEAIGQRRVWLHRLVRQVPELEPWPNPEAPASVLVTRTFSSRGWRAPLWVGLLGLLEDFVLVWDPDPSGKKCSVRRSGQTISRVDDRSAGTSSVSKPGQTISRADDRSAWTSSVSKPGQTISRVDDRPAGTSSARKPGQAISRADDRSAGTSSARKPGQTISRADDRSIEKSGVRNLDQPGSTSEDLAAEAGPAGKKGRVVSVAKTGVEKPGRRRSRAEVFAREGYRCSAPGCTSRRNLHEHHIEFRSRQGGEELTNKTDPCAFHHLRGIHQGLASCRGKAPLGIVWRLGRDDLGEVFINELRQ